MDPLLDGSVRQAVREPSAPRPTAITTKVFAANINNNHTDFSIIVYSDRVFVTITQYNKIGNLYTVYRDSPQRNGIVADNSPIIYETRCIFGVDSDEALQAVRALGEKLDSKSPLLISLTIKDFDYDTIKLIAQILLKHKCW